MKNDEFCRSSMGATTCVRFVFCVFVCTLMFVLLGIISSIIMTFHYDISL